jgi:4-hydroxythreonine-4-phosphate dehydrogenase
MVKNIIHRIALTPGEPAGIGPDLCVKLAQQNLSCQLVVVADPEMLMQRAEILGLGIKLIEFNPELPSVVQEAGHLTVVPVKLKEKVVCGQTNVLNSHYVLKTIEIAAKGCIDQLYSAMVTAPVQKSIINEAGFSFIGHTEYIADITGGYPVMMLATEGIRVALVTTHLPLKDVSSSITCNSLESVIKILHHDLKTRFNIKQPRILICGLNPHAGENGYLGREEIDVIIPVIEHLRQQGLNLIGPLPADTIFTPKYLDAADVVLAMYHDQGLPVLKYQGFGQAVNITLGLPIIRTSVDHGTALDLAGTGNANIGSLEYALQTALTMATHTPR